MTAISNRRRHNRQGAKQLTVVTAWASHDRSQHTLGNISLSDIGDGGLAIECDDYLTPGDILTLELSSGHGESIQLSATICHRATGAAQGSYRYGMFINRAPHEADTQTHSGWQELIDQQTNHAG
jgi:hypothetical protein